MSLFDRLRVAAAAFLFPDAIDQRGRAALVAVERKIASLTSENAVYRLTLGAILRGRSTRATLGCPECKSDGDHLPECEIGLAQTAMQTGAELRAARGESEGKA